MNEIEHGAIMRLLGRVYCVETLLVTGALLLIASSVLGWLDRPVLGWLRGFGMPLSERLPAMLSYGSFCVCAGVFSLLGLFDRFRWVSAVAGGAALFLSLHFLLSYSILNAKDIILVNEFNQQEARMILFNNKNLPTCFMVNPTFDPIITTDTIRDRLYATIHFSTFGWYSAIMGSSIVLVAFCKLERKTKRRGVLLIITMVILTIYMVATTYQFVIAEHYRNRGDYYLGSGMYYKGLEEYEKYMIMDNSSNYVKSFHNHIGKIYYFIGRSDMDDAYLYKASIYMEQKNYPMAIYYYTKANEGNVSLMSPAGASFLVYAYIKYGLYEYENRMKDLAVETWKKALRINPLQIEAYYYMSRAYFDVSSYEESVIAGLEFMRFSRNRIRNAEMSCNLGDSLYKMKEFGEARSSYLKSLDFVMDGNQRALMSLLGR